MAIYSLKHSRTFSGHYKKVWAAIIVMLCLCLCCCDAKGVVPPTETGYMRSFFDPSSSMDSSMGEDETPAVTDVPAVKSTGCVCEPSTASESSSEHIDVEGDTIQAVMENTGRIIDLQTKIASLESRVADIERSSNRLKKLGLAAMSVALAEDGHQCSEVRGLEELIQGFPSLSIGTPESDVNAAANRCDLLGTSDHPALSCNHLKSACDKPNGRYFINNGFFTEVYCEMDLFGGGWARYGQSGMQHEWHFVDEDMLEVTLQIMEPREIKEMVDLKYNNFVIQTDVLFSLQADDSVNPSRLRARFLPWLHRDYVYIDGYGENFTRLELTTGGDRFTCRITPGTSHKCGRGGLPRPNERSDQVIIESIYFGPRATSHGASAYMSNWRSNKYTWSGSYYYVYAK